jgi:hypothetical protein
MNACYGADIALKYRKVTENKKSAIFVIIRQKEREAINKKCQVMTNAIRKKTVLSISFMIKREAVLDKVIRKRS